MPQFLSARTNMVDSQIHPMGVVSEPILNAFRTVQREKFIPEDKKAIAYNDEDLPIGNGRYLMEPVTHARLVQAALPTPKDVVLDVACGAGYSSAIFAKLVSHVVASDPDAKLLAHAEKQWAENKLGNIVPHQGAFEDGNQTMAPYSLIFINGAVSAVSQQLFDQLAPEGRLLAVIRKGGDKMGRAVLFVKSAQGTISERVLFDAGIPWLPGQEPRNGFVF